MTFWNCAVNVGSIAIFPLRSRWYTGPDLGSSLPDASSYSVAPSANTSALSSALVRPCSSSPHR
jgi:hypothetical protein